MAPLLGWQQAFAVPEHRAVLVMLERAALKNGAMVRWPCAGSSASGIDGMAVGAVRAGRSMSRNCVTLGPAVPIPMPASTRPAMTNRDEKDVIKA